MHLGKPKDMVAVLITIMIYGGAHIYAALALLDSSIARIDAVPTGT